MRAIKDHAGDMQPSIILTDLDMTVSRALMYLCGYCNKHSSCDTCKLADEEGYCRPGRLSPCDWNEVAKDVKQAESV